MFQYQIPVYEFLLTSGTIKKHNRNGVSSEVCVNGGCFPKLFVFPYRSLEFYPP